MLAPDLRAAGYAVEKRDDVWLITHATHGVFHLASYTRADAERTARAAQASPRMFWLTPADAARALTVVCDEMRAAAVAALTI